MAGELALLGGAAGILLIAALPFILFIVALWRMGTAQQGIANALNRIDQSVGHLGQPADSGGRGPADDIATAVTKYRLATEPARPADAKAGGQALLVLGLVVLVVGFGLMSAGFGYIIGFGVMGLGAVLAVTGGILFAK
ncbi:MAG: hypothetical protein ACYC2H_06500 [Thermoplasmatota archaeon]